MIRAAIFDVDGTLVDSVDLHAGAWQETFKKFGREIPFEQVRYQIGKGGDQLMPVFSQEELQRFDKEMEAYRSRLFKENYLSRVVAFPKVRELFERLLKDEKRLILASSAKGDELKTYKKLARIEDLIEGETSADDVEKSKPHPDIFVAALAELGDLEPQEALVVGDTPYDAQAARKIDVKTIGFLCGGFPKPLYAMPVASQFIKIPQIYWQSMNNRLSATSIGCLKKRILKPERFSVDDYQQHRRKMMTEIFLVLLTVAILITFIVVTAQNLPRRKKRNDERDSHKAADIERNPALLEKLQQAAELQIGEADEAIRPSRFQPDANENRRAAATGKH